MTLKPATYTNRFIVRFGKEEFYKDLSASVIAVNPMWKVADGYTITVVFRDTTDGQVFDAIDDFRSEGLSVVRLSVYNRHLQDTDLLRAENYTDVTVKSWSREFDYRDSDEVHHTVVFHAQSMEQE